MSSSIYMRHISTPCFIAYGKKLLGKNRFIQLLAPEHGIISAFAYGASSPRSKLYSVCHTFALGQALLYYQPIKKQWQLRDFTIEHELWEIRNNIYTFILVSIWTEVYLQLFTGETELFSRLATHIQNLIQMDESLHAYIHIHCMWKLIETQGLIPDFTYNHDDDTFFPAHAHRYVNIANGTCHSIQHTQCYLLLYESYAYLEISEQYDDALYNHTHPIWSYTLSSRAKRNVLYFIRIMLEHICNKKINSYSLLSQK